MLAGQSSGNHPPRWSSHRKGLAFLLAASAALQSGCSGRGGAPDPVTVQGRKVVDLWRILLTAGVVLGAFVIALILWSVVRYRRPRGLPAGQLPKQTAANVPLEVFYTVIPLIVVAVLFGITMRTQHRVTSQSATPD